MEAACGGKRAWRYELAVGSLRGGWTVSSGEENVPAFLSSTRRLEEEEEEEGGALVTTDGNEGAES